MLWNTTKEGDGTDYWAVCDANGYLKVVTQAGGGAGAATDDAAFTVATDEVTVIPHSRMRPAQTALTKGTLALCG